ncbi:MAG: polyprenyl synthetase family protein [Propionibacteriaceae bacterium]|jgi:heptaprenyl diphosphate synthase|nr:polyprenyl synthetase family protein [Propionibacteriaceae bacterium]
MKTGQTDAEFEDWGNALLQRVEVELLSVLQSDSPFVTEMARHLPAAGGKRFRPMLVIGAAGLGFDLSGCPDQETALKAALVVELTHVGSLYHDDVMDEADWRRGAPSANKRWQNSTAILIGDFIFARSSAVGAALGSDYVSFQAATFARLVSGQIQELVGPAPGVDPVQHHLRVVADKTAALIAASARFGAMAAGADPAQVEALTRFGERLGTCFQLSDDLLDITADDTGKAPGVDLREGVPTLVPLLVRRAARPQDADLIEALAGPVPASDLPQVLSQLRAHPVVDQVRADLARRSEAALAELDTLPPGPARRALAGLCQLAVDRSA